MKNLLIPPTDFTPTFSFNIDQRIFEISGVARPEDVADCFEEPVNWLKEMNNQLAENPDYAAEIKQFTVDFRMSYYNSSSSKYMIELLRLIKKMNMHGITVDINWFYEEGDEKMMEDGEELADALDMDFNYFEMEE